ncbi:MAG: M56 family metallopeptidase, partial [Pseudomonadota bacterium]
MLTDILIVCVFGFGVTLALAIMAKAIDYIAPKHFVRERHDFALAGLLIMPVLFIAPFLLPAEVSPMPEVSSAPVLPYTPSLQGMDNTIAPAAVPALMGPDDDPVVSVQKGVSTDIPWGMTALAVWALGAMTLLLRLGLDMISLRALTSRAQPIKPCPEDVLLSRSASLLWSGEVASPVALGVFRPVIILPEAMVLDRASLPVIEHELAHLARKDPLMEILMRSIEAVFWWNLPLHHLGAMVRREREKLCDAQAAHRIGDHHQLAAALLDIAERSVQASKP